MDEVLMRAWVSGAAMAATMMMFCADANAATPVVVEYTAPPECASSEAFHALLSAQLTQANNAERPWRFSVTVRHENDYVGVLKTEAGTRELRAPTCDEVTAALSLVIAMAQPELPAPQQEVPPPQPITMPLITPAPPPVTMPFAPPHDRVEDVPHSPSIDWRVGLRGQNWQDGSQLSATGATLTLSAELPWGFPKMLFEVGAGMLLQQTYHPLGVMGGQAMSGFDPWLVVDVQACPIDLPLGQTGLSVLGCGRLAVGLVNGVAGWGGGGARLRWQSPWHVFVEAHGNGMYGTKIEGVPALMDFGGSVGFRI